MKRLLSALCLLLAATTTVPAWAQAWPSKPIKIVLQFPPGGSTDSVARILAQALQANLGQPVLVENRPGADGSIAGDHVARSEPDGHTFFLASNTPMMQVPLLRKNPPYDPVKSFTPVSLVGRYVYVMVSTPTLAATNVNELLAYARANPGKLNYASPGNGSPHHLAMEMFKNRTKTFLTHIPYRGAAPAMQDVMGGQVPCMFLDLAAGLPVIQSGKVRALAIGSSKRVAALPDVPTLAEAGVPDTEVFAFQGILAPAGLPAAITTRLNADLNKALLNPAVVKRMNDFGMEALPGTPEQFRTMARAESKRWGEIIKAAGVKLD